MQAYLINAEARTIEPFFYNDDDSWSAHLPGGLTIGWLFANRDVLYVDDEALLRQATMAFRIRDRPDGQPMMSHGILTGADSGNTTLPPSMSIAEIGSRIEWLDVPDALAWFRARADEPAVTFTRGGEVVVLEYWFEFLATLEGRDEP